MKILLVHTKYQHPGGEDTVVEQELNFLREQHRVETLFFQNLCGLRGAFQFLASIWNVRAAANIRNHIKQLQPDVIHVHNWHFASGPVIFRVARKMKVPVVHTLHNYRLLCPSAILLHNNALFTESLHQNFPWTAVHKKVYRNSKMQTFWLAYIVWFHKKLGTWKEIDKFICLTPFAKELFLESNFGFEAHKFIVKPNFTLNASKIADMNRGNPFLFVGRLSEEKGIETLLDAFKGSNFILHIVGDGPLRDQVEKAQREYKNIQYLGALPHDEVYKAMQQAQALIFPSIWYETFGMTIIEAFSNKTPVIASAIGSPQTLVKNFETGFLFDPGDSQDLRSKVELFAALTEEEKKTMQQNAFTAYKQEYSKEKQLEYFKEIYSFN